MSCCVCAACSCVSDFHPVGRQSESIELVECFRHDSGQQATELSWRISQDIVDASVLAPFLHTPREEETGEWMEAEARGAGQYEAAELTSCFKYMSTAPSTCHTHGSTGSRVYETAGRVEAIARS